MIALLCWLLGVGAGMCLMTERGFVVAAALAAVATALVVRA